MKKTVTEILNKSITIPCYLCGKGKIKIRAGDIFYSIPHPIDWKMKNKLRAYLTKQIEEFFTKINKENL